MLNSTMHSRKNEVLIELKNSLISYMSEQENTKNMCEEQINRIKEREISWISVYACIAVMVVSGLSSITFIAYGYSEVTWIVFRNILFFVFSGAFAYGLYCYNNIQKNKFMVEQWSEIKERMKNNISNTREHLTKINKQLYE